MESTKLLHTEIITTLEAIDRVNESIARHKKAAQPDQFGINQWQEVKDGLLRQLYELLAKLDALPVAVAA
ncbi:MAG: hypothetical protein ABIQ93_07845 [Saprospiraceae bacterium]